MGISQKCNILQVLSCVHIVSSPKPFTAGAYNLWMSNSVILSYVTYWYYTAMARLAISGALYLLTLFVTCLDEMHNLLLHMFALNSN